MLYQIQVIILDMYEQYHMSSHAIWLYIGFCDWLWLNHFRADIQPYGTATRVISNHFYCHITTHCALVSEILESVLQTVQKQFTYRQYILTDLYRRHVQIHIQLVDIAYIN